MSISEARFDDNEAECGGAIYSEKCIWDVSNSEFNSNRAKRSGGAILLKKSEYEEDNVSFMGNEPDNISNF